MNLKSLNLVAALLMLGSSSIAQTVDWESLPDLVSKAPATLASHLRTQAAEARKGFLGRSLQPKVNIGVAGIDGAPTSNGSFVPQSGTASAWVETSGELSVNLWNGNRDNHRDASFDAEAKASSQDASRDFAQRLSEARRAWLEAWVASRRLEILSKVIEQSKDNRQRAEKKANAGLTSQTDVMEFELRLRELDLEVTQAQEQKDAGLSQLAALLGISSGDLDLGAGVSNWPQVQATKEGPGPDELALAAEAQARLSDADSQGVWPFPSLDAGLRGLIGGPDTSLSGSQGYEARLGLNLSLWDSGQAAAERNYFGYQAKALFVLAESAKKERLVRQEFSARRINRWDSMAKALQERLNLSEEFRDKVSKEYARGVKDGRDLEGATQAVFDSSVALIESQSLAWQAWLELEKFNSKE